MNAEPISTAQAAGTAVASSVAGSLSWSLPLDAVGLSAAIVFMAFAGSAAGLIVTPPEKMARWRMYALSIAYTLFASAFAVFVGKLWPAVAEIQPVVALLVAFFAQAIIPAVKERLGREVRTRQAPADPGER